MSKILQGKVISNKMNSTAIVEVLRRVPHRLYRKIIKISKKFKVDTKGQKVEVGQMVKIIETRPIAKDKHFAIFISDINSTESTAKKSKTKKEKKA
ncbi:30S ribosomal protein S17 [Patescibacteria group bacterium]|nr:30S ribosomal protein S17 [Patescibacteria group bacterium]MBU4016169.1 30S ribosomal protein S17 [Patescibacteria group bacterium]MBU4098792.1 30S ribosomal protein S17 [Patescibacteria group bacterium]